MIFFHHSISITQFPSIFINHPFHTHLAPSLAFHDSIFFTLFVGPITVTRCNFFFFFQYPNSPNPVKKKKKEKENWTQKNPAKKGTQWKNKKKQNKREKIEPRKTQPKKEPSEREKKRRRQRTELSEEREEATSVKGKRKKKKNLNARTERNKEKKNMVKSCSFDWQWIPPCSYLQKCHWVMSYEL